MHVLDQIVVQYVMYFVDIALIKLYFVRAFDLRWSHLGQTLVSEAASSRFCLLFECVGVFFLLDGFLPLVDSEVGGDRKLSLLLVGHFHFFKLKELFDQEILYVFRQVFEVIIVHTDAFCYHDIDSCAGKIIVEHPES